MTKQDMYNMIAILVVTLILSLMLVLSTGCAYYSVTKTADGVEIKALSWRDLKTPYINYYRDGDDKVGFTFSADEVTGPDLKDVKEAIIGLGDSLGIGEETMLGVVGYCNQHPVMCKK
jgi:hypothetical protein